MVVGRVLISMINRGAAVGDRGHGRRKVEMGPPRA
jgi:hypothetical protein